jgi:hypothetical protein
MELHAWAVENGCDDATITGDTTEDSEWTTDDDWDDED